MIGLVFLERNMMQVTSKRKSRPEILAFFQSQTVEKLEWLERVGPDFTWVLRNLYGPTMQRSAARKARPMRAHVIIGREIRRCIYSDSDIDSSDPIALRQDTALMSSVSDSD